MPLLSAASRLSSKGQIVVPKAIRDAMGWSEGQRITLRKSGERVVLETTAPARPKLSWDEFDKAVPRFTGKPLSIEEMDNAIETFWRERTTP